MLDGMDYRQGQELMQRLCRDGRPGRLEVYGNLVVHYPGRKRQGDYRLEMVGDRVPTHADICRMLHDMIVQNGYSFEQLDSLLDSLYKNGTRVPESDEKLRYLQHLIYWVTLQEEINYPRAGGYAGIRLAYCRFYEAIYCAKSGAFPLDEVIGRCNNHGRQRPVLYDLDDAPEYYRY